MRFALRSRSRRSPTQLSNSIFVSWVFSCSIEFQSHSGLYFGRGPGRVQNRAQNGFEIRSNRRIPMRQRWNWKAVLGIAVIAIATQISLRAELTEELHKTYTIDADGRVSLKNVNGAV